MSTADIRDIVREQRPPTLPTVAPVPTERGSGWQDSIPLRPPSHTELIDRITERFLSSPRPKPEGPVSPPARAPHEPINYLDRVATLPPNVIADMAAAVPDAMVRGIVADSIRRPSEPVAPEAPSGERPLADVPRAELADAIVDRLAPKAG